MNRHYHLCLNVRGALLNWSDSDLASCMTYDDGRKMTAREVKLFLMDEIAKGHKVIPTCECSNFNHETGCGGHESTPNSDPVLR